MDDPILLPPSDKWLRRRFFEWIFEAYRNVRRDGQGGGAVTIEAQRERVSLNVCGLLDDRVATGQGAPL